MNVLQVLASPVSRERLLLKNLECLFAELADPIRVFLGVADVVDRLVRQAGTGVKGVVLRIRKVPDVLVDLQIRLFLEFGFAHGFFLQAATRSFSTQS